MKRNLRVNQRKRVRRRLGAACLSLLLATLPISRNALAQTTSAPPNVAPAPTTSVRMPNTECTLASPDFGDKACATGKLLVFAPLIVAGFAVSIPIMVIWVGGALAFEPFVLAGGRNPCD